MNKDIYPSYLLIFIVFNLLGWWFKGKPFFSWWWIVLVIVAEILILSLTMAITKKMLEKN